MYPLTTESKPLWVYVTRIVNVFRPHHPTSCAVNIDTPRIPEIFQPHVVETLAAGLNLRDYNTFNLTHSRIRSILRSEKEMIEVLEANNYAKRSLKWHEKHLYMALLKKCNLALYAKLNPKPDQCSPICKEICVSIGSVACRLMPFALIGVLAYLRFYSNHHSHNTDLTLYTQ